MGSWEKKLPFTFPAKFSIKKKKCPTLFSSLGTVGPGLAGGSGTVESFNKRVIFVDVVLDFLP